jgi:hypothetical protein
LAVQAGKSMDADLCHYLLDFKLQFISSLLEELQKCKMSKSQTAWQSATCAPAFGATSSYVKLYFFNPRAINPFPYLSGRPV